MNLCSNGHDEVCFESKNCPVCEMEVKLKEQISKLEDQIKDLENEVDALSKGE